MAKKEKELTIYDASDAYQEEIAPLVKKINILCKAYKIPFIFGACVKNDDAGSVYKYEGNLCGSNGFVLKEDKITDFVRILAGFKIQDSAEKEGAYTIGIEDDVEIDFDDMT